MRRRVPGCGPGGAGGGAGRAGRRRAGWLVGVPQLLKPLGDECSWIDRDHGGTFSSWRGRSSATSVRTSNCPGPDGTTKPIPASRSSVRVSGLCRPVPVPSQSPWASFSEAMVTEVAPRHSHVARLSSSTEVGPRTCVQQCLRYGWSRVKPSRRTVSSGWGRRAIRDGSGGPCARRSMQPCAEHAASAGAPGEPAAGTEAGTRPGESDGAARSRLPSWFDSRLGSFPAS